MWHAPGMIIPLLFAILLLSLLPNPTCAVIDEALAVRLASPDTDERLQAVETLGFSKDPAAIPPLLTATRDLEPRIRALAIRMLMLFDSPLIKARATEMRRDTDITVKLAAAYTLQRIKDPRPLPELLAALRDPTEVVRNTAVKTLRALQFRETIDAVLALVGDPDPHVRQAAATVLGYHQDPRIFMALQALLRDDDQQVRCNAAESLGRLGDTRALAILAPLLEDKSDWVCFAAAEAYARLCDKQSLPVLLAYYKRPYNGFIDINLKGMAISAAIHRVVQLTPEAGIPLTEHADPSIRRYAIEAISDLGDPKYIELFVKALGDEDRRLQLSAARAVAALPKSPAPVDERIKQQGIDTLIKYLADIDPSMRSAAIGGLRWFADKRAIEPLIPLLNDDSSFIRTAAANALKIITGQDYGTDAAQWRAWWEGQRK